MSHQYGRRELPITFIPTGGETISVIPTFYGCVFLNLFKSYEYEVKSFGVKVKMEKKRAANLQFALWIAVYLQCVKSGR